MMKYLIGVCCAMLLCLSACGEIDSPEFPPSRVDVKEMQAMTELPFNELEQLVVKYNININPYENQMYMISGNIVLDSPYQRFSNVDIFISPSKEYLSEKALSTYNIDYNVVQHFQPTYLQGTDFVHFWPFERRDWGTGTFYYRVAASKWSWGNGPGILNECLQQDGRQATYSELKSFTITSTCVPYAEYRYAEWDQDMHASFHLNDVWDNIAQVGVCLSMENQLPTIADQSYRTDMLNTELSFPRPSIDGIYYIRPFVVTKDNVVAYGYVEQLHYSK